MCKYCLSPDEVDGIDSWEAIRTGVQTKREWMGYNLHTERNMGAIRFKNESFDLKLLFFNDSQK